MHSYSCHYGRRLMCEQSPDSSLQLADTHIPLTGSSLVFLLKRLSEEVNSLSLSQSLSLSMQSTALYSVNLFDLYVQSKRKQFL